VSRSPEATVWDVAKRQDPDAWTASFPRRSDDVLPFDLAAVPSHLSVMLDTDFYIDRLQRKVPLEVLGFVADRRVIHSAVAMQELTVTAGILDPAHSNTPVARQSIINLLGAIDITEVVPPGSASWIEAGMIAGILARTQHLNRSRKELSADEACCQQGLRRKLLNDALIFLSACEEEVCLVSANVKDMDLLLRFRPDAHVLLYRPVEKLGERRVLAGEGEAV
jgi:hypothetical protein